MGSLEGRCSRAAPALLGALDAAIDATVRHHPAAFDKADEAEHDARAYKVLDRRTLVDGVIENLRAKGYCAQADHDAPREIIQVKASSASSEEYELTLSSGHLRRGRGSYRETCTPSSFPLDPESDVPPSDD
jgi:hypothetical protein